MAVRIERVEREFILVSAAEARTEARLQAAGRTLRCRIVSVGDGRLALAHTASDFAQLKARQRVSVYFDFRGQGVSFTAPVLNSGPESIDLGPPEGMYRSLSRRWPRVPPPSGLAVDFILPDAELKLDCPESVEWAEVELPELQQGLETGDLSSLVASFKAKAETLAGEGRVIMFKDRSPLDAAQEMAAKLGRVLFVPSTLGGLPQVDPYPRGRIITRDMAEDFEGLSALVEGSPLGSYLAGRAAGGLASAVWCPVVYYRYTVGMVELSNGTGRPKSLGLTAVDLAWEFARVLAWFLRRHGYFGSARETEGVRRGSIIDASPSGLLVELPAKGPRFVDGSLIKIRLSAGDWSLACAARVARRYGDGNTDFYGLAFQALMPDEVAGIARGLYGEEEAVPLEARGRG
ncbi:MAG TPA: PilZ domain-containing protein [Rectinemataceae bacterium]|nr:PilZ domain-containing protein [Rectinemataceae bacterium]